MDRIEWRRRDREETLIASCEYTTNMVEGVESKPTGIKHTHVLLLFIDGNGVRYVRTESTDSDMAKRHTGVLKGKVDWKHHGLVPEHGRRPSSGPKGKLIALPGGLKATPAPSAG